MAAPRIRRGPGKTPRPGTVLFPPPAAARRKAQGPGVARARAARSSREGSAVLVGAYRFSPGVAWAEETSTGHRDCRVSSLQAGARLAAEETSTVHRDCRAPSLEAGARRSPAASSRKGRSVAVALPERRRAAPYRLRPTASLEEVRPAGRYQQRRRPKACVTIRGPRYQGGRRRQVSPRNQGWKAAHRISRRNRGHLRL